jgi:ribonucleoside-diphosphate reductase alpha chain
MRNAACTTIAPTGTISIIAGCSAGIEPLFALVYMRRIRQGRSLLEVNAEFVRRAREGDFYSLDLLTRLARGIPLSELEAVPGDMKRLFAGGSEIPAARQVQVQAAFQRHVDNAVSKTVNLPHSATARDVADVYMLAYSEGLKGVTVYRDGSRRGQPLEGHIDAGMLTDYLKEA